MDTFVIFFKRKILLSFFFLLSFQSVFADSIPKPKDIGLPGVGKDFPTLLGTFTNSLILLVGAISVISISYGGILFITSFGEEEKVKKAKKIIVYSIIGIIASITSYTLVEVVNSLQV